MSVANHPGFLSLQSFQSLCDAANKRSILLEELGFHRESQRLRENLSLRRLQTNGKDYPFGNVAAALEQVKPHRLCPRTEFETRRLLFTELEKWLAREQKLQVALVQLELSSTLKAETIRRTAKELRSHLGRLITSSDWKNIVQDYFWFFHPGLRNNEATIHVELFGVGHLDRVANFTKLVNDCLTNQVGELVPNSKVDQLERDDLIALRDEIPIFRPWAGLESADNFATWARAFTGRMRFHTYGGEVRGELFKQTREGYRSIDAILPANVAMSITDEEIIDPEIFFEDKPAASATLSLHPLKNAASGRRRRSTRRTTRRLRDVLGNNKDAPAPRTALCGEFGERLSSARQKAGYAREQLARMVGASVASFNSWEKGQNYPRVESLIRICELLKVTSDHLLFGETKAE